MRENAEVQLVSLVERAQQGDQPAFEVILNFFEERAKNFVAKKYGRKLCAKEIEDVVESSFVTAWQKLSQLKNPSKFSSWFYTILMRRAEAEYRRLVARKTSTDSGDISSNLLLNSDLAEEIQNDNAFYHLVSRELVSSVTEHVNNVYRDLKETQQKVFVARFVHNLTETQIANLYNLPIGTVRSSAHRIRNLMQGVFTSEDFREIPVAERASAIARVLETWASRLEEVYSQ